LFWLSVSSTTFIVFLGGPEALVEESAGELEGGCLGDAVIGAVGKGLQALRGTKGDVVGVADFHWAGLFVFGLLAFGGL
jgi:hypothetical protein